MNKKISPQAIPLIFRYQDAKELAGNIINKRSVVLIGITRVGIGNFLSFFINRKDVVGAYIQNSQTHLFISVNMNDLIEREIPPFWTLTLKRIVDAVESSAIKESVKKEIRGLFLESIQLQDLFFTIDSVRLSIKKIIDEGYSPTIFFIKFDRLKNSPTPEFFANLEGLRESTHHQLTYVFTSYSPLKKIFPNIAGKHSLSILYKNVYFKPADNDDANLLYKFYKSKYEIFLSPQMEKKFIEIVDGHFQYMQLGLISLHNLNKRFNSEKELKEHLINDERIRLQSEELWESLNTTEQRVIAKIVSGKKLSKAEKVSAQYLWDVGLVVEEKGALKIFSDLFSYFIKSRKSEEAKDNVVELSKKEQAFFEFLKISLNTICEREKIVETVWPEASDLGISDWAIDKLAARVRTKLKLQKSQYELQTIKTRGFKLTEG